MKIQNETDIILTLYRGIISKRMADGIPVWIRPNAVVGTVQDDPFDCWVEEEVKRVLPCGLTMVKVGGITD